MSIKQIVGANPGSLTVWFRRGVMFPGLTDSLTILSRPLSRPISPHKLLTSPAVVVTEHLIVSSRSKDVLV